MIDEEARLHKSLPDTFKIILRCEAVFEVDSYGYVRGDPLCSKGVPPEFVWGDRLEIENHCGLDEARRILLKPRGEVDHKIMSYQEFSQSRYSIPDVIGPIATFERSCCDGWEFFLGEYGHRSFDSQFHRPELCAKCARLEYIGAGPVVIVCCLSSSGPVRNLPLKRNEGCNRGRLTVDAEPY